MRRIPDDIIRAVIDAGFEVYMRDEPATWMYFTNGKDIGYLECGSRGTAISTVHVPNTKTGTGFPVAEFLSVAELTKEKLSEALAWAPLWAINRHRESVVKWGSLERFLVSNTFNGEHKRVTRPE